MSSGILMRGFIAYTLTIVAIELGLNIVFDAENRCSYGDLPVITCYFYGIMHSIHSINGVLLVLIADKWP